MGDLMIFIRADGFYPVEAMNPAKCGKTLEQQARDHAEINPGTLRVEDCDGRVLWQCEKH